MGCVCWTGLWGVVSALPASLLLSFPSLEPASSVALSASLLCEPADDRTGEAAGTPSDDACAAAAWSALAAASAMLAEAAVFFGWSELPITALSFECTPTWFWDKDEPELPPKISLSEFRAFSVSESERGAAEARMFATTGFERPACAGTALVVRRPAPELELDPLSTEPRTTASQSDICDLNQGFNRLRCEYSCAMLS